MRTTKRQDAADDATKGTFGIIAGAIRWIDIIYIMRLDILFVTGRVFDYKEFLDTCRTN